MNDAELAAINRRYEQTSFKSRGDYCRYSALTVMNVEEDNESLLAAARGISSVSNSFNQVAHRVNKTGHLYESDIETMKKGMNEIWQLLTSIRYTKERTAYKKEADRLSRLARQKRDSQKTVQRYLQNEQATKRKKNQLE